MNHFRIKVCGITRLEDAQLADQLGADMLGFVFYKKSPRFITIEKAQKIISKLPPTIDKVGVFIEAELKSVLKIAKSLKLDYAQLHGENNTLMINKCQAQGIKVIESFYIIKSQNYRQAALCKADIVQFDNRSNGFAGGTGKRFDWSIKPRIRIPNLMLAGGINSENVAEAVRKFQPLIIDVNSGVEKRPGIKSSNKLKYFFKVCNQLRYGIKN